MLPDTVTRELGIQNQSITRGPGPHIATTELKIIGSVHHSGEAYLSVGEVYGSLQNEHSFSIRGSTHESGHEELSIGAEYSSEFPPAASLPDRRGFSEVMNGTYEEYSDSVHIGSLVIFDTDTPEIAKVLDAVDYECYDSVELYGAVHEPGVIHVNIDKVFIMEP